VGKRTGRLAAGLGAVRPVEGGGEQPAADGERRGPQQRVGGERDDPGGPFAAAFAPCPFGRGQLLAGAGEELDRVGHQPLLAARQVEDVQPVGPVVTGARTQEGDPGAVRGDGDAARAAEGEPLGARVPAWERRGVRHGR
jgi:hypothetical protein